MSVSKKRFVRKQQCRMMALAKGCAHTVYAKLTQSIKEGES